MSECDKALAATGRWLETMVIGEGLCPFAGTPFRAGRIRLVCTEATDTDAIYRAFLTELDTFVTLDPEQDETGLFVLSQGLKDFDEYLDMLAAVEEAVDLTGLNGVIQVASFHPDYRFDGTDDDDPANYTNRSPYPIFHLIREEGLEKALKLFPKPEMIPERNMEHLRQIGLEELQRRLAALKPENDA